eukprot:GEMP01072263.1.p2 GENE.GEMP01072263.1~~GEMP01072263.1.p2  ORF type:complete len:181 (+),score=36.64 GEMP01072263.1:53-544(+)
MSKNARMAQWLDYRVRISVNDQRILVGSFLAFDKYMNVVLADTEEFRKIKTKTGDEREVKRNMGLIVLRGEHVVSMTAEAPPAQAAKKAELAPGPGKGQVAGRGMGAGKPVAPLSSAPAGLTAGGVRGIGGPALAQMMPKAGVRPPQGMPPAMPSTVHAKRAP